MPAVPRSSRALPAPAVLAAGVLLVAGACKRTAPSCNTLDNQAAAVAFVARPGPPPVFAGGPIADGVYRATRAEGYGSATRAGRRMTLAVSDGATHFAWAGDALTADAANVMASIRANAQVSVKGNRLALTTTCSSVATSPLPDEMSFSATPDQLTLAFVDGAAASVTTYTRVQAGTAH